MSDQPFEASSAFKSNAHISTIESYRELYDESVKDTEAFWDRIGKEYISWFTPFLRVREYDYNEPNIKFYIGGKTNVCYNCIDRHLDRIKDKTAIIWEGNDPSEYRKITYAELHNEVSRFANVLKANGVAKGDRVTLYMPMIPELAIAMLALCQNWRCSLHCVWWLFCRVIERTNY